MDKKKPAIFAVMALLVAISWTLWKGKLPPEDVCLLIFPRNLARNLTHYLGEHRKEGIETYGPSR